MSTAYNSRLSGWSMPTGLEPLEISWPPTTVIEIRSWKGSRRRLRPVPARSLIRSEEHTSELQSLMRISYAVFCLKKKTQHQHTPLHNKNTSDTINHYNTQINTYQ